MALRAAKIVRDASTATLVGLKVGWSSQFLHHLFAEHLGRCFPAEAFSRRIVEAIAYLFQVLIRHCADVTLARKPASGAPVGVLDRALLPG